MNIHSQKILGSTFGLGAVVIFGLMGYNFLSAAVWAPPTAAPASNNTETPVNIGTNDQIKNGGLGVDALSVVGGDIGITSAGPRLKMTNTTAGSMDWWLHNSATSFYLIADRNGNGNWNLPSESPWPMQVVASTSPAGDYARFSNAVRSPKYCDENGLNCFDAADVGTIVGGGQGYINYARQYCGLNIPNPGSISLHGVKLKNGSFRDFYDGVNATAIIEWECTGPNATVDYDIENACGLTVSNPSSPSIHGVRLRNGSFYDIYDSNNSTEVLEWRCTSPRPELAALGSACNFSVQNPGSFSLDGIIDRQQNFFDLWDPTNSTARLVWSCL